MENRRTLAVLGARGVGKSSVVERFCYNRFYDNYNPTIMAMEHVTLKIDGKQYQCDIMDPVSLFFPFTKSTFLFFPTLLILITLPAGSDFPTWRFSACGLVLVSPACAFDGR